MQKDTQTDDVTKLIGTFHDYANAPKKEKLENELKQYISRQTNLTW
jgi:hypothetical protein